MASMRSLIQVLALCSTIASSLAATAKLTLILVPGAFHIASVYDEIITQLGSVGYEHVDTVDLPSVGDNVADVERTADTNIVIDLLETRLNNGEDVILVGNSYGATVIMEAVKEFEDRSAVSAHETIEGEGRILGLMKLSGYIPTIAEVNYSPPHPDIRGIGAPFLDYHLATNGTPTTVTWDLDLVNYPPQLTFYNLLDTSAADYWTSQLLPSSFKALNATVWALPLLSYYLDKKGAKFGVETIAGDHIPTLSMPEVVVELIRRFAGEKLGGKREAESRGSEL